MPKIKLILFICVTAFVVSCSKKDGISDDISFVNTAKSANVDKIFEISNDNTGNVKITPTGEGATSFIVEYGHGTGALSKETVMPGASASHAYPEGTYSVNIIATDIAGKLTSTSFPLKVTYRAPENVNVEVQGDMQVKASALYAKSFLVYYGDVANEVGTPMAVGQTLPGHIYPAGGPFTLKVVALSGGAATTAVTKPLFGLPITYEVSGTDYFFGSFGDGQGFGNVANPSASGLNMSANVGRFNRGNQSWSGTYSPLNIPINFALGKKIKILVYTASPSNVGKRLNVELESAVAGTGATGNGVAVLKVPLTTSGAWEELTFDFGTIPAIGNNARFNQLVFRFDDGADNNNAVVFVDNIRITN